MLDTIRVAAEWKLQYTLINSLHDKSFSSVS